MDDTLMVMSEGLVKKIDGQLILDDIDLTIRRGSFTGILGPVGSGKTTLAKCLVGLIRPDEGELYINGNLTDRSRRRCQGNVAYVPFEPSYEPNIRPDDVLAIACRTYGLNKTESAIRTRDVLELLEMWDWHKTPVKKMTPGLILRLSVATALIANPSMIVLDDPFHETDMDTRQLIEDILIDARDHGTTIVMTTTSIEDVRQLCNYTITIDDGRIVCAGNTRNLMAETSLGNDGPILVIRTAKAATVGMINDLGNIRGAGSVSKIDRNTVQMSFAGTEEERAEIVDVIYKHNLGLVAMYDVDVSVDTLIEEMTSVEADI